MEATESRAQVTARFAAVQSMTEIGLGSAVHAWRVPLGGHVLSLNQSLILVFASRCAATRFEAAAQAAAISSVAGLMKLLSPAGKRVMPMIAIVVQGLLFSAGIGALGLNALGCAAGAALLAVWGFAQPVLFAYLLYGQSFFHAIEKLWSDTATKLGIDPVWGLRLLLLVVGVKLALAGILAVLGWKAEPGAQARYLGRLEAWALRAVPRSAPQGRDSSRPVHPAWGAALDLLNPWFLGSLVLTAAFVAATAAWTASLGLIVRAVAGAWFVFFVLRAIPAEKLQRMFTRFPTVRAALDQVLKTRSRS